MIKIIVPLMACVLGFAACKKSRTCTCTGTVTTVTSVTTSSGTTQSTAESPVSTQRVYTKAKKSAARANCLSSKSDNSDTNTSGGVTTENQYTYDTSCTLK